MKSETNYYIKGKTETFHIRIPKSEKLLKKLKAKAALMDMSANDFMLRLLRINTEDITLTKNQKMVKKL